MAEFRGYSRRVNLSLKLGVGSDMTKHDWIELALACLDQAYEPDVEARVRLITALPREDGREVLRRINQWPGLATTEPAPVDNG
jgi:hypothetical protein